MSNKHRLQMQRQPSAKAMARMIETVWQAPEEITRNRINQYTCGFCGGVITTIDRHEGTTPAMLACRAEEGCNGTMHSAYYRCDQSQTPDYEWYKPAKPPKGAMYEHVKMGGLLIRRIESQ